MTASTIAAIDASLAVKWVLDEPDSEKALALLTQWQQAGIQPVAPSWFACEVANVLFRRFRAGDLTIGESAAALMAILEQVQIEPEAPDDAYHALHIAAETGQKQSYDAQYAALAERLGCELWTADKRFRDAARGIVPGIRTLSEVR